MPFKQAHTDRFLQEDVAAMILDNTAATCQTDAQAKGMRALAKDIITVVRERVLREIQTYTRNNVR